MKENNTQAWRLTFHHLFLLAAFFALGAVVAATAVEQTGEYISYICMNNNNNKND